ncbi:hypothetical protein FACS1894120_6310 [Clostridia bacterium]|nr:hypothetical protein FACS1894120_6310 [Clostridia bacterium]
MKKLINLFGFALEISVDMGSLYRGIRYDKIRLVEFADVNDWFGISPVIRDKAPHIAVSDCEMIRKRLCLWLSAFKQPNNVKLKIMFQYFEPEYPQTCQIFRDFINDANLADEPSSWKLLDCIFSNFDNEITECSEIEIEDFVQLLDSEATLNAAKAFADFMKFANISKWNYEFYARERADIQNNAYPLKDYAVMAYCVFNEDIWECQNLINKAVESSQFADLWLYTALHFLCALRGTDIVRISAPKLPYEPERVIDDICNGIFSEHLAAELSDELVFRLKMKGNKPLKTAEFSNIPEIKLYIPESLAQGKFTGK